MPRLATTVLLVLTAALASAGCTHVLPIRHDASVIDFGADRRGTYIFKVMDEQGKPRYVVISEPPPDAAKEIVTSLGVSAESIGQIAGGEAKLEYANKVVDLARRSQTLQVLREAMFRLAEMGASADISTEQRLATYQAVLDFVAKIADAELKQAEAERLEQRVAADQSFKALLDTARNDEERRLILMLRDVPEMDLNKR
jgi:hypothetical protein